MKESPPPDCEAKLLPIRTISVHWPPPRAGQCSESSGTSTDARVTEDRLTMSEQSLPPHSLDAISTIRFRISTETANQWTHGLGLVAGVVAATCLLARVWATGTTANIIGCSIYAVTMVALYAASTLSHSFECPDRRKFFRMLDQVCIFLFVVGNFTPFVVVHIQNSLGWALLAIMWTGALTGCYFRIRAREKTISPWFFLPLAWLPVMTMGYVLTASSWFGLAIVLGGGVCYTGGLWFLMNDDKHPYFHAVWHLSTITGAALHFLFTFWYVATPGVA